MGQKTPLQDMVDNYSMDSDMQLSLTPDAQKKLYDGVLVDAPTTHRRSIFVRHIENLLKNKTPKCPMTSRERKKNPELATTTMSDFLGTTGLKLYQEALAEEVNSKNYMDAVLQKSTKCYDGEKWIKRPIVIVAGPSGCGKSYAADAAVKEASKCLIKGHGDIERNYVLSVDGGIAREVSQMQKLVIRAANKHGFSGISDLHKHSSNDLEKVKERVLAAAFSMEEVGIVIPETFSGWLNPMDKVHRLMPGVRNLKNSQLIFARVVGVDNKTFKDVVYVMGNKRAWKTDDSTPILDLNNTENLSESKAYGSLGFYPGVWGSHYAENWFVANVANGLRFTITNDLVLKKKNIVGDWEDATSSDTEALIVSKRAFENWIKEHSPLTLENYIKQNKQPVLIKSANKIGLEDAILELHEFRTWVMQLAALTF